MPFVAQPLAWMRVADGNALHQAIQGVCSHTDTGLLDPASTADEVTRPRALFGRGGDDASLTDQDGSGPPFSFFVWGLESF